MVCTFATLLLSLKRINVSIFFSSLVLPWNCSIKGDLDKALLRSSFLHFIQSISPNSQIFHILRIRYSKRTLQVIDLLLTHEYGTYFQLVPTYYLQEKWKIKDNFSAEKPKPYPEIESMVLCLSVHPYKIHNLSPLQLFLECNYKFYLSNFH